MLKNLLQLVHRISLALIHCLDFSVFFYFANQFLFFSPEIKSKNFEGIRVFTTPRDEGSMWWIFSTNCFCLILHLQHVWSIHFIYIVFVLFFCSFFVACVCLECVWIIEGCQFDFSHVMLMRIGRIPFVLMCVYEGISFYCRSVTVYNVPEDKTNSRSSIYDCIHNTSTQFNLSSGFFFFGIENEFSVDISIFLLSVESVRIFDLDFSISSFLFLCVISCVLCDEKVCVWAKRDIKHWELDFLRVIYASFEFELISNFSSIFSIFFVF